MFLIRLEVKVPSSENGDYMVDLIENLVKKEAILVNNTYDLNEDHEILKHETLDNDDYKENKFVIPLENKNHSITTSITTNANTNNNNVLNSINQNSVQLKSNTSLSSLSPNSSALPNESLDLDKSDGKFLNYKLNKQKRTINQ